MLFLWNASVESLPRHGGVKSIALKDMWQVYILKSVSTSRHYIGCTDNLDRRLKEHNNGYNLSTFRNKPWVVVHVKKFSDPQKAFAREKEIKSYKGGNAFKKLLKK